MTLNHALKTTAVCLALSCLVACTSKADRLQQSLEKGSMYVKQAEWDKANVEVRNALQIDPKNAEAYYISGQVAEAKREIQRAYGSFSKAVELKPDFLDAKVALGRIYLLAGDTEKADKEISAVLAANPTSVGALTIKAALTARQGDVPGAIEMARKLLTGAKPVPTDVSMLLAGLYNSQGRAAEALNVIDAALAETPKNLGLLEVAAQITASDADPTVQAKAAGYFRRATEVAPKNNQLWNAWAVYQVRRKDLNSAEAVLREAIKSQPDDSERTLALLEFLSVTRGRDVAEKEFLAVLEAKPKDTTVRFGLVRLYQNSNRADDARRELLQIVEIAQKEPAGLTARDQLAADALSRRQTEEARKLIDEVLAANPRDNAALLMRARILLAEGNATSAIIDLRSVMRDQPGSPEVAGLLAQAHRQAGEPQLAREVLMDALKAKPDNANLMLLVAADMADAKDYKAAGAEIDKALKAAPQDLRAWDMKAELALARKQPDEAEKVFASLKTQFPKNPAGWLRLGKLYGEQKKYDAALKEYDAAAKLAPDAAEPALYGIGILITQRRFDDANARIDEMAKRDPKNVLPYQLRGEVALARGDAPAAESAYRKMVEFAPTVPAGYLGLARIKTQRNAIDDAIAALQEGERAIPDNNSLTAARAELLSRAGRTDDSIAAYETLVKRAPDDEVFANNLAYQLIESKGDKASLERALALTTRFKSSTNPGYLDTLGWAHYKLGQYAEAAPVLERSVQLAPDAPLLQLHLGMALYKSGNTAKGQELVNKALGSNAKLPGADEARKLISQG